MKVLSSTAKLTVFSSVALLAWLASTEGTRAHAQRYDGRGAPRALIKPAKAPPPPPGDAWVTLGVGATAVESFLIGDPSQLDLVPPDSGGETEQRERFLEKSSHAPSLRLSLGVHHRFKSIDLGGAITHQAGQPALFDEIERRLPGYVQGQINLRWRVYERHWGGFYGGLGLGGLVSQPSHGFRASVAFQFEGKPDLTMTDERLVAFSASSSLGMLVYHGDDLGFFVEYVVTLLAAEYRVDDHQALVSGTNECIQAGVTWTL